MSKEQFFYEPVVFFTDDSKYCLMSLYPPIPYDVTQCDTFEEATTSDSLAARFLQSTRDLVKTVVSLPCCRVGVVIYLVTARLCGNDVFPCRRRFPVPSCPMVIIFMADGCSKSCIRIMGDLKFTVRIWGKRRCGRLYCYFVNNWFHDWLIYRLNVHSARLC